MKILTGQSGSADLRCEVDVLEWQLPMEVLRELLKDQTTGRNIVWATKDYERQFGVGKGFGEADEITAECLIDREHPVIRPRTVKPITRFPHGKTWLDYVCARRLEVACGEAPYLTSRYDAVNGDWIAVEDRVGFLDRKLRLVGENLTKWGPVRWFEATKWAVQSVYGYDWQGDNVLLARENILFTVMEHYNSDFDSTGLFTEKSMLELAEIISWFLDHDVHNVLEHSGFKHVKMPGTKAREWYKINLERVKKTVCAVNEGRITHNSSELAPVAPLKFREEQERAIEQTLARFKKHLDKRWDAKIRFGKTPIALEALEVVRRGVLRKTIVITHRLVVATNWREDFNKVFPKNETQYEFVDKFSASGASSAVDEASK